jgi:hypothetical protein
MMRKISQVLLGSSLLLVAMVASAGQVQQGKPANAAQYPQCQEGGSGASRAARDAGRGRHSAQNSPERADGNSAAAGIDEYLSFHTQVIEDKGKFSLMPWFGLRTHAN